MLKQILSIILLITGSILGLTCRAQSPTISRISPLGLRASTNSLQLIGDNLSSVTGIWSSFATQAAEIHKPKDGEEGTPSMLITLADSNSPGIGAIRVYGTNGVSGFHLVLVDDLSVIPEASDNSKQISAQSLPLPIAVDGYTGSLENDYFSFEGARGQRISVEVVAQRLGSPVDPVVRLLDRDGRELAFAEDTPGFGADVRMDFAVPATGRYWLEVRDSRFQGSSQHRYRLRVSQGELSQLPFLPLPPSLQFARISGPSIDLLEVEPNNHGTAATRVSEIPARLTGRFHQPGDRDLFKFEAKEKQRLVIYGRSRSLGSPSDLVLTLRDAQDKVLKRSDISAAVDGAITNQFEKAGDYFLTVEELTRNGGTNFFYAIDFLNEDPGFTLSLDSDKIEGKPGDTVELKVNCLRIHFDGPITLSLVGPASGISITNQVIAAKGKEATLKITVPEAGAESLLDFSVLGEAELEGRKHRVWASTVAALRKSFPLILYPPLDLDGLVVLGIKRTEKTIETGNAQTSPLNLKP